MPKNDPKKNNMISIFPEFSPMRIKYKDIFDMKAFYETLREWLLENEWKDQEDGLDHWETYYGERIGQGGAKEIWIRWRTIKNTPDAKYLTYHLDLDFHVLGLVSTEVIKEGQKMKVNKGEVELHIRAFIEKLYEKEFSKNSLLKQFQGMFTKRVYRKTLEQRKKELYQETYALNNFIKQWFKLKRYLPYEESKNFFTSYAWPSHLREGE